MKILVTGAAGQLAFDLIPALRNAGFEVSGFDVAGEGVERLDITDMDAVEKAVIACVPDVILNTAAYTKVDLAEKEADLSYSVNRDGASNLASAANAVNASLVHISTDFVFDGSRPVPYKENDATNPVSVYGASKLAGEAEVRARLKEHVIVRTSWLYGVHGANFVKTMIRHASEKESLRVVYDQAGSPTWTVDLSTALVEVVRALSAGKEVYGTYHYSNEGVASWYDFADAVIRGARKRGAPIKCSTLLPILTHEYPTPAKRPPYSVMDKGKIKETFGISIPYWRASLCRVLDALCAKKDR